MAVDCVFGMSDVQCGGKKALKLRYMYSRVMEDVKSVGHKHIINWNRMHSCTE